MRIAFIGHHGAPIAPPFAGGMESLTWYLGSWLAQRGHDVTLYATPGSSVPGVEVIPLDFGWQPGDIACRDVSMPEPAFMRAHHAYMSLLEQLQRQAGHFDVVQIHCLHYIPVGLAGRVGAPTVLTLHCPPTPWLESALRVAAGAAPYLVGVSEANRASWSETVDVGEVILNGVDLERWSFAPRGGRAAIWSGRIVAEKAPHVAIEAARMAGLPLWLAGPISNQDYFDERVRPWLGAEVRYLGCLDHSDLRRRIGESAVLLQTPQWDEPFCLAAAEAIACGTPVAAFDRGGLREVVGADAGVLSPPDDPVALAAAARRALALPRDRVRGHAEAALSLDRVGNAYEALYERLSAPGLAPDATLREMVPVDG